MVRILPTLMAAALCGLAATPAAGGSIAQTPVSPSLDWQSDCNAPARPTLYLDDIESYHRSLAQFNSYVARVQNYIRCVQNEGKSDIDTLAAAVARDMQKKQNAAIKTAEELRTELEVQRNLLR